MSLFMICNNRVIGELLNARTISGFNIRECIKIDFTDGNILEFIKEWIYSISLSPIDNKDDKDIYFYNDVDNTILGFKKSINPIILKNEKDWFGNPIIENVISFEYESVSNISIVYYDDIPISSIIASWKRDKKINQIIG